MQFGKSSSVKALCHNFQVFELAAETDAISIRQSSMNYRFSSFSVSCSFDLRGPNVLCFDRALLGIKHCNIVSLGNVDTPPKIRESQKRSNRELPKQTEIFERRSTAQVEHQKLLKSRDILLSPGAAERPGGVL